MPRQKARGWKNEKLAHRLVSQNCLNDLKTTQNPDGELTCTFILSLGDCPEANCHNATIGSLFEEVHHAVDLGGSAWCEGLRCTRVCKHVDKEKPLLGHRLVLFSSKRGSHQVIQLAERSLRPAFGASPIDHICVVKVHGNQAGQQSSPQGFHQSRVVIEACDRKGKTKQKGVVELEGWLSPLMVPPCNHAAI